MKIHEFQAKKIFLDYGIPIPEGETAKTPEQAKQIAEKLGETVVVKAQIHAGGRGKGGGVNSPKHRMKRLKLPKVSSAWIWSHTRPALKDKK